MLEAGCRLVAGVEQHVPGEEVEVELALEEAEVVQLVRVVEVEVRVDEAEPEAVGAVACREIFVEVVKHTAHPHLMIQLSDAAEQGELMEA